MMNIWGLKCTSWNIKAEEFRLTVMVLWPQSHVAVESYREERSTSKYVFVSLGIIFAIACHLWNILGRILPCYFL